MVSRESRAVRSECGQSTILLLDLVASLLLGAAILGAFGQALGAKGRHQRAADLAAMSAARTMSRAYPRLFEAAYLENGAPNPRHLSNGAYVSMARRTAVRTAGRNGVRIAAPEVTFPGAGFAPTRVTVTAHGRAEVRVPGRPRRDAIPVRGRATAELSPSASVAGLGMPAYASGGGYDGPLAYRMGKPMRPDVALAFDRMAAAARREAGLYLAVNSGFRSDAEQARLWAAKPNPHLFSAL